jgi:predicted lipoprotein with Yx(FWY)xxD motif
MVGGARRFPFVVLLIAVSIGAAACSSSPSKPSTTNTTAAPASSNSTTPGHPGVQGLTLYSWKTSVGTAVGSNFGVVVYADKDESNSKIECTGTCTKTWHPWLTHGAPVHAAYGVLSKLIGTVKRADGKLQMTYGGHPLYLYAFTKHALQANAQGAGGVWYVIGTNGQLIT